MIKLIKGDLLIKTGFSPISFTRDERTIYLSKGRSPILKNQILLN